MTSHEITPRQTPAFYLQAVVSFGVSVTAVGIGIAYLPAASWVRAFLALGMLFVITSSLTLAKCVRDRQEQSSLIGRVDEVKLQRFLADHDPFTTPGA